MMLELECFDRSVGVDEHLGLFYFKWFDLGLFYFGLFEMGFFFFL